MDHAISIDGSEIRATPNERLQALKARNVLTPHNQRWLGDGGLSKIMDHDLYKATKEGDDEKFINALEKVSGSRKLALSLIFDQVTPSGNSLLHVAASSGKEDVIKLILDHFPYLVTRKNSSEDTPLHVAVRTGSLEATRKLICLRRDWEIMYWKNNDSKSPLYLAVENCKSSEWRNREGAGREILQLLLEASARDEAYAVKIEGMSPVLAALEKEKIDLLEEVIDRLPKLLDVRGEDGGTPLHSAASLVGYGMAVGLLLWKCPDLALQTDKNGSYPIHVACQEGSDSTICQLIEHTWPDLAEIKNNKGQNILHVAAKAGNNQAMVTISAVCDGAVIKELANSKDADGNTPLHLAAMHDDWYLVGIIDQLMSLDLAEIKNNKDQNILHVAAKAGKDDEVHAISNKVDEAVFKKLANLKDADGNTPLHLAAMHDHRHPLEIIGRLTWPYLAEIKNIKGQNILHVAAKAGNDNAVYGLSVVCDGDVFKQLANSKDADGNTPLHLASMHNHCGVMQYLTMDKRTDLTVLNNDKLTALDVAMKSESLSTEYPALLGRAILIFAGARPSESRDVLSPREQRSGASTSPRVEWIKDQVNTLLLVATLVTSVTFTAGLTLPGGYNASGDPHPGTATALHHRVFQLFVIANTLAMHSSILAVVVLLWGLCRDFYIAKLAYHLAGPLLLMALTNMTVAFSAAVTVAVSKLTWLWSLVLSFGVLYLAMVVVVLAAFVFSFTKSVMWIARLYYLALRVFFDTIGLFYLAIEMMSRPIVTVSGRIFRLCQSFSRLCRTLY